MKLACGLLQEHFVKWQFKKYMQPLYSKNVMLYFNTLRLLFYNSKLHNINFIKEQKGHD